MNMNFLCGFLLGDIAMLVFLIVVAVKFDGGLGDE